MGWLVTWIAVLMVAALGVVASANGLRFRRKVASEVREMWTPSSNSVRVDRSRITTLPHPVHRYLLKSIGSRDLGVRTVRLRHGGVFRTKLDGPWLRIRGEQYFNAGPPAFIWWGRIRIAPGVWVDARDRWIAGAGNMRVSLESTLTLADAKGPEIDQGAMLRLLAEMVWFPSILADGRYVSWTAMDGRHVQAKLRVSGREVAAVFEFGEDELPATISADRYRDVGGGKAVLTPWSGECRDYRQVDGMLVPHELESYWHVTGQRISVLRFEVDRLEYNVPFPFD